MPYCGKEHRQVSELKVTFSCCGCCSCEKGFRSVIVTISTVCRTVVVCVYNVDNSYVDEGGDNDDNDDVDGGDDDGWAYR